MVVSKDLNINIEGEKIDLGATLEEKGNQGTELHEMIENVNRIYCAMNKRFISRKKVTRKTELRLLKVVHIPIKNGMAVEMKYLRKKSKKD